MEFTLFSRRKPWQSPRREDRLAALESDLAPEIRRQLALEDDDPEVRRRAVATIADPALLDDIAAAADDADIRQAARNRADRLRLDVVHQAAVDINEQLAAVAAISGEETLVTAAAQAADPAVRLACLDRLHSPAALVAVGRRRCGKVVARRIVDRLDDRASLEELARSGASLYIQRLAAGKLAGDREPEKEDMETILQEIADNAQRLVGNRSFELAERRLAELEAEWRRHDPEMTHSLAPTFIEARESFFRFKTDWIEKERRQAEERRRRAALEETAGRHVEQLTAAAAVADPGFPDLLARWQALELPAAIRDRFQTAVSEAEDLYAKTLPRRQKEEERLARMLEEAKAVAGLDDVHQMEKQRRALARARTRRPFSLIDDSPLVALLDDCHRRFRETIESERDSRRRQRERLVGEAEELCRRIEELADDSRPDANQVVSEANDRVVSEANDRVVSEANDRLREIEDAWQQLSLPAGPPFDLLVRRYRRARARLLTALREHATTEEWRRWANHNRKENLIATVEALAQHDDYETIVAVVRDARRQWKEIGPAGRKADAELWQRFDRICTEQYERCRAWLDDQHRRWQEVMDEKERLLAETVALVEGDGPLGDRAARIRAIQQRWKELGPVPRSRDRRLADKFRRQCQTFFETYQQYRQEEDERRRNNLAEKERLCEEVEALAADPAWEHQAAVRRAQQRWKTIGPVPADHNQAIWERFRQACDRYYGWLDEERRRNLDRKRALVEQADTILAEAEEADDLRPLTEALRNLQQEWKTIGPVPKADSESIWNEFRQRCDRFFALKEQRYQAAMQQRLANQEEKEALIAELEQVVSEANDRVITGEENDSPETAERVKEIQKRFAAIGPAPREEERRLRRRMQELCDDFFQGRRQRHQERRAATERLRTEKERLLFELERLAGIGEHASTSGLSLAEQLKIAMQTNFVMADRDLRGKREEVARIERAWRQLPPLPMALERKLRRRYQQAMDAFRQQSLQSR